MKVAFLYVSVLCVCILVCIIACTPASLEAEGWHWVSASITLVIEAVFELEGGSFWTHWTGNVPFWPYWLGTKLSGSVYLCNPSTGCLDGAAMPGMTWSGSLCSCLCSKHFTCWAISPYLNFNEIQTFPLLVYHEHNPGRKEMANIYVISFKGIFRLSRTLLCWRALEKSPWSHAGRGKARQEGGSRAID